MGGPVTRALANVLQQQKVTVLWLTSSLFNVMIEDYPDALKTVKQLLTGGEALSRSHVQKALELLPDTQIINGYGPTENTTFTCCYPIQKQHYDGSMPIGRPINGTQVFIVDKHRQPMPMGYVGELVTSGAGLARGYLNQPQLTAEKFVEIELFGKKQRVYKTGDLARWLPNSTGGPAILEFVGRVDQQIKLRGLRIELGEIERTLAQHASVQDNVIVCTQDDKTQDKRILAYVVADQNNQQHSEDVLQQSSEQIVAQWEEVFDSEYQGQSEDHSFNLSGWTSSYTGKPIPANEMEQWVDNTVATIISLKPKALLEIGCGTGLLLSRIAPHCQNYRGTDLSSVVLAKVAQLKKQQTNLQHVELHQNSADDFSAVEKGQFDTLVLNSVVQYFPSVSYLVDVLEQAITAIKPGGHVFVGDIRHLGLLNTFHASVQSRQESRQDPSEITSKEDFQQKVLQRQRNDKELLVHPHLFLALLKSNPRVSGVTIRPHRGAAHNELTRFRYQVIIDIEHTPTVDAIEVDWLNWSASQFTPEQLQQRLETQAPAVLGLRNVANARLAQDNEIVQWMNAGEENGDESFAALSENLAR
ncbi:MAG: AMP-binding protein, partial [Psychrosphaera sp.]|nr:AMP-binding protein [Psychrosphaera sp.]